MGKARCNDCDAEVKESDVFVHEGKPYCPECTIEHMRSKHAVGYKTPT